MYNAFRYAFMIEMHDFFAEDKVLQENGAALPGRENDLRYYLPGLLPGMQEDLGPAVLALVEMLVVVIRMTTSPGFLIFASGTSLIATLYGPS